MFYVLYIVSCHLQSSNSEGFTSSFLTWIPLLFCCCCSLIAVARISKTMLNSSGESGHPCQIFTVENNICSGFVIYIWPFPRLLFSDQSCPTVCNPVD